MNDALVHRLLSRTSSPEEDVAEAVFDAVEGRLPLTVALLHRAVVDPHALEALVSEQGPPHLVERIEPRLDLVDRLPAGLCELLEIVPFHWEPRTGIVDVALIDDRDEHAIDEVAFHLASTVRPWRASVEIMNGALAQLRKRAEHRAPDTLVPVAPLAPSSALSEGATSSSRLSPDVHRPARRTDPIELRPLAANALPSPQRAGRSVTPLWGALQPPFDGAEGPSHVDSEVPIPLTRPQGDGEHQPFPLVRPSGWPVPIVRVPRAPQVPSAILAPAISPEPEQASSAQRAPFEDTVGLELELAGLGSATSYDAVLKLLLEGACQLARRVALFVVRKEAFVGWSCNAALGMPERMAACSVAFDTASLFDRVVVDGVFLGPLPSGRANAALVSLFAGSRGNVLAVPVRVLGKAAAIVITDDLVTPERAKAAMLTLCRAGGEAFARIARASQT